MRRRDAALCGVACVGVGFLAGILVGYTATRPPGAEQPVIAPTKAEKSGVAVTIVLGIPRPLVAAQISIVSARLPESWRGIDIFCQRDAASTRNALGPQLPRGVQVTRLSERLRALDRRSILLSLEFWEQVRERRVLYFEAGATVLCSGGAPSLDAFGQYSWIGAAWKWAKPASPHSNGGNGALSLRDRDILVDLLRRRDPPPKGNEDMWFVSQLAADRRNTVRLAPPNVSALFAVEEVYDSTRENPPVGVYHLMRTMPYANRSRLLKLCPEAKILFAVDHDPRCAVRCPRDTNLLGQPLSVWKERCSAPLADARACDLVGVPPR